MATYCLDGLHAQLAAALGAAFSGVVFPCDQAAPPLVTRYTNAAGGVGVVWTAAPTGAQDTTASGIATTYDLSPTGQATDQTATLRAQAKALLSDAQALMKALRSVLETAVDEINLIRARLRDQDAAVAAATSFADLKSRWATVASNDPMPARTYAQAKTAALSNIDNGNAD